MAKCNFINTSTNLFDSMCKTITLITIFANIKLDILYNDPDDIEIV